MKIAVAQLNPTVGAIENNAEMIIASVNEAHASGARLIVLPELVLPGYPPRDLLNIDGFIQQLDEALEHVRDSIPAGIIAVLGTARRYQHHTEGRRLVNAAVALERGKILLEVPKALLPTYDVFDEHRYFEPAPLDVRRVLTVDGVRVGLTICEDIWNDRLFWQDRRRYHRDPMAEAVEQGAEVVLNLSASPFSLGKHRQRAKIVSHAATRWRVPVVFAAVVGGNDGLIFDGGSMVARPDGEWSVAAPLFDTGLFYTDLDSDETVDEPPQPAQMEELADALVLGLRDYARKTGFTDTLIGLSGGIDSALVATLAALALGPQHVLGVAMPSRYSSEHSIRDAQELARDLGIEFMTIPIEPGHSAYETMLKEPLSKFAPGGPGDVTFENVQARVRGALLMAISNRTGKLLLITGNKSECSVGYATLYGDMSGGLAVIADLWKGQVRNLSRWLNEHRVDGAIPESTLTKPPSAELRPGQRDDQSLPPYERLDPILQGLVEGEASVDEVVERTGEEKQLVQQIARKLYLAEYKRKQFAPTLRVSTKAWVGRDVPIAQAWRG